MTELASSLGCQYDHCVDYDSMDGTPEGLLRPGGTRAPGRLSTSASGPWTTTHAQYMRRPLHRPAGQTRVHTLRLARACVPGLSSYGLDSLIDHFTYDLNTAPTSGTGRASTPTRRR
jgi:hypothetical protein